MDRVGGEDGQRQETERLWGGEEEEDEKKKEKERETSRVFCLLLISIIIVSSYWTLIMCQALFEASQPIFLWEDCFQAFPLPFLYFTSRPIALRLSLPPRERQPLPLMLTLGVNSIGQLRVSEGTWSISCPRRSFKASFLPPLFLPLPWEYCVPSGGCSPVGPERGHMERRYIYPPAATYSPM